MNYTHEEYKQLLRYIKEKEDLKSLFSLTKIIAESNTCVEYTPEIFTIEIREIELKNKFFGYITDGLEVYDLFEKIII